MFCLCLVFVYPCRLRDLRIRNVKYVNLGDAVAEGPGTVLVEAAASLSEAALVATRGWADTYAYERVSFFFVVGFDVLCINLRMDQLRDFTNEIVNKACQHEATLHRSRVSSLKRPPSMSVVPVRICARTGHCLRRGANPTALGKRVWRVLFSRSRHLNARYSITYKERRFIVSALCTSAAGSGTGQSRVCFS